ncbi:DNRLRE domain-containing protein [Streptomyces liangshanensis]|uniref:DNRLRE domain-containing protein n=1 Tax=Streptomyces liangshanensis TaxID=2717324 RepID=A0A6G9H052_9ACTN|nr:DNRLRE domain-containing protein [Streptomyces liangshanensis]QIQ03696.1 DNRLRE domain-containing protein [Streptomyces liangshanensis]
MPQRRNRLPGRRAVALACAAAITATGLTYAGLRLTGPEPSAGGSHAPAAAPVVKEADALTQAARTGKPVEISSLRTADTTTWARPDGQMSRRIYVSPIRAEVDGVWETIDTSLHRTGRGWEPAATNTKMVFSAGSDAASAASAGSAGRDERASRGTVRRVGLLRSAAAADDADSPLVTLHADGHDIQLTWPGPVPQPIIDGDRALYPEIIPGADLVLTADDEGFSQLLVVKNRAAAADPRVAQLAYGLSSPTLSFRLDPASDIVTAENSDGDEIALSPSPVMWDNAGSPAVTDGEVGATAQPTAPEVLPSDSAPPEETPSPSESTDPEADGETDEQRDPYPETLPPPSDESVPPVSESPLPPVPAEPTPAPSQTGSAATLSLPALDGPSPDSHGALVEAALAGGKWLITPDADLLTDPSTVYPVFIDPSVKKHVQNWTTVYDRYPKATFYNGKGFNKGGTHEARVGFESDTWGTSRSFLNIDYDSSLKGTVITKATLRLLETYAWSCTDRAMSVHLTGEINSKTNWKNAPKLNDGNKITTRSFAHGYKSGCRDAYETFDVKKAAQTAADKGADTITFGMRAVNEDSQYSWKKFAANGENAPYLEIVYNRRPDTPTSLDLGPDARCTTTEPYVRIGAGDITFTASAGDKDRNLDYLDFDLWPTGKWETVGDMLKTTGKKSVGGDTTSARVTTSGFSTTKLTNNTKYSWRVRSVDDAGSSSDYAPKGTPCRFIMDTAAPRPPVVTSTDFPNADANRNGFGIQPEDSIWSTTTFGIAGSFTFRALDTDVVRYEYGFNSASYPFSLARTNGTAASVSAKVSTAKPPTAGPNVLYVRAVDAVGHVSEPNKYLFYASPKAEADTPGDFTGDELPDLFTVADDGRLFIYPSQATNDLSKGSGDLDYSMPGAYRGNPDKDPNGDKLPDQVAPPTKHFDKALITHNGDIYGGDGLQDLVVRVEGKLWVYPGDGYGAVDTDKRREILLPAGAPDPATFTQIVSAGDATGDGKTDFFVTVGDALWALTGYSGATVEQATRLSATAWTTRDIVTVLDITGDGVTDLLYRTDESGRLLLRTGIKRAAGGVDLNSLASAATSQGGADTEYAASGWFSSAVLQIMGTPDANDDNIPDIWALRSDGSVRLHLGGRAALSGTGSEVIGPNDYWKVRQAIG